LGNKITILKENNFEQNKNSVVSSPDIVVVESLEMNTNPTSMKSMFVSDSPDIFTRFYTFHMPKYVKEDVLFIYDKEYCLIRHQNSYFTINLVQPEDKFAENCNLELKKVTDYITLKLTFTSQDEFDLINQKVATRDNLTSDEL
jgi:hypothetical protein